MQNPAPGYAGGNTNGPFDNGQYVRYGIWSRDVNALGITYRREVLGQRRDCTYVGT
jgi:hypothetical protein